MNTAPLATWVPWAITAGTTIVVAAWYHHHTIRNWINYQRARHQSRLWTDSGNLERRTITRQPSPRQTVKAQTAAHRALLARLRNNRRPT